MRGVKESENVFGHHLRVHIAKLIGGSHRMGVFVRPHYGGDQMQEGDGCRLVVAAGYALWDVIGGVVAFDAGADSGEGFIEWIFLQVQIGDLHMGAVGPLIERQGDILKLSQ